MAYILLIHFGRFLEALSKCPFFIYGNIIIKNEITIDELQTNLKVCEKAVG